MPEAFQKTGSRRWRPVRWGADVLRAIGRGIAHLPHHLPHHLPGALVVASLVTIGHLHFHVLDAIDSYAFIGLGNLSAMDVSANATHPEVAVVVIDQRSYEGYYHERSPLDRCQLWADLKFLYELPIPPKLVVIDLDLSPPAKKEEARSTLSRAGCQEPLNQLLENSPRTTRTVLMEPLELKDEEATKVINNWKERMKAANIDFGEPSLPFRYGLVIKIECDKEKLAAKAVLAYSSRQDGNCLDLPTKNKPKEFLINPRQYITGLRPVSALVLPSQRDLLSEWPGFQRPWELPVVFFGGSYGDDDTYLTPLGIMYGVEVHAAAYMSLVHPANEFSHLLGFAGEVGIGLLFGGFISFCWRRYFAMRFSHRPWKRQISPFFVFVLGGALIGLVLVTTFVSLYLLSTSDYWLSPIPIALGMLIESFFVGAVHEAVEEGHRQRQGLVRWLDKAHKEGPDRFQEIVATELRKHPEPRRTLYQRCSYFIVGEIAQQFKVREFWVALALLVRRVTFFTLLGYALLLIVTHY